MDDRSRLGQCRFPAVHAGFGSDLARHTTGYCTCISLVKRPAKARVFCWGMNLGGIDVDAETSNRLQLCDEVTTSRCFPFSHHAQWRSAKLF